MATPRVPGKRQKTKLKSGDQGKPSFAIQVPARRSTSKAERAAEMRWQAEDDMRILRQAAVINSDSRRLQMAQKMAQEEIAALSRIQKKKK